MAKGFEIPRDLPACSKKTIRTVIALIAQIKWELNFIGIKTSFLQKEDVDREIFIMTPNEAETNNVWLLKK